MNIIKVLVKDIEEKLELIKIWILYHENMFDHSKFVENDLISQEEWMGFYNSIVSKTITEGVIYEDKNIVFGKRGSLYITREKCEHQWEIKENKRFGLNYYQCLKCGKIEIRIGKEAI